MMLAMCMNVKLVYECGLVQLYTIWRLVYGVEHEPVGHLTVIGVKGRDGGRRSPSLPSSLPHHHIAFLRGTLTPASPSPRPRVR